MRYEILSGAQVVNTILADPGFMAEHYPGNYRELVDPSEPQRPELVVVSLTCDPPALGIDTGAREVTCVEGCRVTAHCELRMGECAIPLTDTFRMPIQASDGREEFVLARMVGGLVSATFSARSSGEWNVSESGINARMPEDRRMTFRGVTVFVVQS